MPHIQRDSGRTERFCQGGSFRIISGKWLFQIDRFAGLQAGHGLFVMKSRRCGDIYRVNLCSKQRFLCVTPERSTEVTGGIFGGSNIPPHDGTYGAVRNIAECVAAFFTHYISAA